MKLFFARTISLIVSIMIIHLAIAGASYAQNYHFAANTKITPHEPVIVIKNEKKSGAGEESWFQSINGGCWPDLSLWGSGCRWWWRGWRRRRYAESDHSRRHHRFQLVTSF
ncbi:MAG: hypothetical protein R2874_11365 [Desulfobacterales bacterium]